jgi:staphylococcal nuclease domain-containing protein 1
LNLRYLTNLLSYSFFLIPSSSNFLTIRLMSKSNPVDEPGAFPAREWLRKLVVGKQVRFETRKQGASAGDRVYGWLFIDQPAEEQPLHLSMECVRQGHATPKNIKFAQEAATPEETVSPDETEEQQYEQAINKAYKEAVENKRGIHATDILPLVRNVKNAGEDFATLSLVMSSQKVCEKKQVTCVIEYVFDGSRFRCQVIDPDLPEYQYSNFTLLLAGASCPRLANLKADPPTQSEPFSEEARKFVTARMMQRELKISLLGTDKSGSAAVGTIHHPAGNISVELLKNGLARMTDWTVRLMPTAEVPALRFSENQSKRTFQGIWKNYAPPVLQSASKIRGTVVEVLSGDTVLVLAEGKDYVTESDLQKISLASIRAPRLGRADGARADEPFAAECKERVRVLTIGKLVNIEIHYERDIPLQPGAPEKRAFGTLSVGKHADVSETLISEGLAVTQRHHDEDEKSPRYDELRAAEAIVKATKKGVHNESDKSVVSRGVNDLTEPKKAKSYSGALMRAGTTKAVVDYVFNGALFKLLVPGENCYIRFAPNYIRCPQPSPNPGSRQQTKVAEPFGDESKRHARLQVMQRNVEISCSGVTNSGIITGTMYVHQGGQKHDYATELLGAGLANLDARKVEYGEVPKHILEVEEKARENKVGIWSVERPETAAPVTSRAAEKTKESVATVRLSEIRSGSHFYFYVVGNEAAKVVEDSMKLFTENHGTAGAPCDVKIGKVVAALFDDGKGKSWYRAKIVERKGPGRVSVLFLDHGNLATVPVSTHLRPLDISLDPLRIPAVAKEASLALTVTRSLDKEEGVDAARFLQSLCWGKDLKARFLAPDETGKLAVALYTTNESDESVNAQLISEGLARCAPSAALLASRMSDGGKSVNQVYADLQASQESARRTRVGMWRYGDVGDDDDAE